MESFRSGDEAFKERFYPEASLLVGAAGSVWGGSNAGITICITAGERLAKAIRAYTGSLVETVFVTDSDIRHIKKRHGCREQMRGQDDIVPDDFALLPLVLNEFDSCEHVDTDKLGNKKFLLKKAVGTTVYVVTIQRGKRKLEVKTMWKRSGASC